MEFKMNNSFYAIKEVKKLLNINKDKLLEILESGEMNEN